jgi:hypothetical protein
MSALIKLSRRKTENHPAIRWNALSEFLALAVIERLTGVQRIGYLAYWYASLVSMGGHEEYFSNPAYSRHIEIVEALRAIGAVEQADILVAANTAVEAAGARAPEIYENRHLAGVEFADLTVFDDNFESCTQSVPDALIGYMIKQEKEFIEWNP